MATTPALRERLEALGYDPHFLEIGSGRVAWLRRNLYSADLCIAPIEKLEQGIEEYYTFDSYSLAYASLSQWDPSAGEPLGWIRHKPSDRRRVHGDPAQESVRP